MKRLLFSLVYYTGMTSFLAWFTRGQVKILCYHSVTRRTEVIPEPFKLHLPESSFRAQLRHLKENYQVISLSEYVTCRREGHSLPPRAVILTFDDGFRNFYTVAAPLLQEFGFPATVFIITSKTDEASVRGVSRAWQPGDDLEHMNWEEARELLAGKKVSIGSHTHTHQRLPGLSLAQARQEIDTSLQSLAANLGLQNPPLSYPHGQFSHPVQLLAEELGHSCAVTSEVSGNHSDAELYSLRRIVIAGDDSLASFAARLSGLTWLFNTSTKGLRGLSKRPVIAKPYIGL
jgi:peptidoglycan/xylan/chitin deacetylase (PgdA/CDA1 family)